MIPHGDRTEPLTREDAAAMLRTNLAQVRGLRREAGADAALGADRNRLRTWQSERLALTHHDLLEHRRFGPPAAFFLSDLYGPKDFSQRDEDIERIAPTMVAVLPAAGIHTVAVAIGLDALSEALDAAMVRQLRRLRANESIDASAYARAYRACDNREQRVRQIELVGEIGRALAQLTHRPLIGSALKLMRKPAQAAGLGALHEFLQNGYEAFRHMGDADEFLDAIAGREWAIMQGLFAGRAEVLTLPGDALT
jgi:hypothetical protein